MSPLLIEGPNANTLVSSARLSGLWPTGGTATTTKPQMLIETAGTTSTAWSASGTGLGVNSPSGFAGNIIDFKSNNTTRMSLDTNGILTCGTISASATASSAGFRSNNFQCPNNSNDVITLNGANITSANLTTVSAASGTNSATSGSSIAMAVAPIYNQASGSAANTDLLIKRTETTLGSGAQRLLDMQIGSTSIAYLTNKTILFIGNTPSVPAADPSGGGYLYVDSGALKYRGSSGTITTLANA